MSKHIYLAIDAGTTKMKAALVDETGMVLSQVDRGVSVDKPHEGWCEMDMEQVYSIFCSMTGELTASASEIWSKLEGVGVSGQGDGCWPVDREGKPVRKAILWNDTRDKSVHFENWNEICEYLIANKGAPALVGAQAMTLRWIKDNEPEVYSRIRWIFHCKDWLNFRLTGETVTDYSDCSTALINVFKKEYLDGLFELMDVPEGKDMQPALHNSHDIIGRITATASAETGIPEGTPVIAGALDVAAVALGAGVTAIGDGCSIMGTSLCNFVLVGERQVDHRDTIGSSLCHIVPDTYIRLMATLSGCSSLDWARELYAPDMPFGELERALKEVPFGANGVIYHPYIYGERSPFCNPDACGGFYGITARTTRFDMLRAAYEGFILMMKDCYNHLPACGETIYLSGGGSRSDLLCQMAADALGKHTMRLNEKELGIIGMVKTLNVSLGLTSFEVKPVKNAGVVFAPDKGDGARWDELYGRFIALRNSMVPHWSARAAAL